MAGHDVPEPGEPIEILVAIGVGEEGPVALDPHVATRVNLGVVEWVNQVREIAHEQFGIRHRCCGFPHQVDGY